MAVNKENVTLWVEALRSGKFTQTQEILTRVEDDGTETDCCLGVACKIAIEHGVELEVTEVEAENYIYKAYSDEGATLPVFVMEWLGFDDVNPELKLDSGQWQPAAVLNDSLGYTYRQIADAVERTYLQEDS